MDVHGITISLDNQFVAASIRAGNFLLARLTNGLPNLSTLVTQTSFRTSDGEFHGFEGCNDHRGCCFGNCTHVWNYETSTQFLFPSLARSLRKAADLENDFLGGRLIDLKAAVPRAEHGHGAHAG